MSRDDLERFCRLYRPNGPAWTGVAAGSVIGCAGIVPVGDTGWAWALLSHPVRIMAVHRAVLRMLEHGLDDLPIKRIEARALADWPSACQWLERLGFRRSGNDGEFGIYVR